MPHSFAVVLNDAEIVLGRLSTEAMDQRGDALACDVMDPGPVMMRADQPVSTLTEWMRHHHLHTVLVTTSQGRFLRLFDRDGAERAGSA